MNELLIKRDAARLLSFAYPRLLTQYCELVKLTGALNQVRVMVDSGAFTAWSKGTQVELEDLSTLFQTLLEQYGDRIAFVLINLDVIPGRKGVDPTAAQIDESIKRSEENFQILNKCFPGYVLPVFHQGEPESYYKRLVKASEYICLSPRNDLAEKWRVEWAQDWSQRTKRMYHGLATTGLNMMETVPWHSVDSAGWVMVGGYGNIFWSGEGRIRTLAISDTSKSQKEYDMHLNTLSPIVKDHILSQINAKGYKLETLQKDDTERYMWNAELHMDLGLKQRHMRQLGAFEK